MHDERGDNRFAAATVVAPERVHVYGIIPMMIIGPTHRKPRPHRRESPEATIGPRTLVTRTSYVPNVFF